jgi:hypothetical protein
MLDKVGGWNFCVSTTLRSSISKERRIKWLMHSAERVHELDATTISMYQTDIKSRILEAANADLQYKELVAKL